MARAVRVHCAAVVASASRAEASRAGTCAHRRSRPRAPHRRQARDERAAIALGHESRIAQHDDAEVGLVADQATDALLQRDHGLRHLLVEERIAALRLDRGESRLQQRIVRHRKRQLVDHDDARAPGPLTSTPSQKLPVPSSTALPASRNVRSNWSRDAPPWISTGNGGRLAPVPVQFLGRLAQRAMAREQQERATATRLEQWQRQPDDIARSARARPGSPSPFGRYSNAWFGKSNGLSKRTVVRAREAAAALEMRKIVTDRERRRREDPRARLRLQQRD